MFNRSLLCATALSLAALPAHVRAQDAIYCTNCSDETTDIINDAAVAANWVTQLARMTAQIQQQIAIFEQLSGLTNVNGMVTVLNQFGNFNQVGSMGNVTSGLGGTGGGIGAGYQAANGNALPTGSPMPLLNAVQTVYNQRAGSLATVQGVSSQLLTNSTAILNGLRSLQQLIDQQPSSQLMGGMNARLTAYNGNIQSQQYQLTQVQAFANAQQQVFEQSEQRAVFCSASGWAANNPSLTGQGINLGATNCAVAAPGAGAAAVAGGAATATTATAAGNTDGFDTPVTTPASAAATNATAGAAATTADTNLITQPSATNIDNPATTTPATTAPLAVDPSTAQAPTTTPIGIPVALNTADPAITTDPAPAVAACTTSNATVAASGSFTESNGVIVGPNGQPFVPKGINVMDSQMGDASQILADFPGLNFVRLNVFSYQSPQAYQAFIDQMTAAGVVVELEDHTNSTGSNAGGGDQGGNTVFTGQQLTNELNWYSSVASYYANDPYVWFGTDNEPAEATSPNGADDPAALSAWQQATYSAIRSAGNNSPIMLEDQTGLVQSYYSGMTNTIWDDHYYGWESNYSTDPSAVESALNNSVASISAITNSNGVMPVIVGEYGPSTNGQTNDPNASQVLSAVRSSGLGSVAWGFDPGATDDLTDGGGNLTSFGQEVANWMGTTPACTQSASFLVTAPSFLLARL